MNKFQEMRALLEAIEGGEADGMSAKEIANKHGVCSYDLEEQLEEGVEEEMEHTDDKKIAKEIAKDHLAKRPDYYKKLEKMEMEPEEEL